MGEETSIVIRVSKANSASEVAGLASAGSARTLHDGVLASLVAEGLAVRRDDTVLMPGAPALVQLADTNDEEHRFSFGIYERGAISAEVVRRTATPANARALAGDRQAQERLGELMKRVLGDLELNGHRCEVVAWPAPGSTSPRRDRDWR